MDNQRRLQFLALPLFRCAFRGEKVHLSSSEQSSLQRAAFALHMLRPLTVSDLPSFHTSSSAS